MLTQYFKKGYCVAARKVKCRLKRMKVVTFQHIMKMPIAIPTMAAPNAFTFPIYSGARKRASAPNDFINAPPTTLNRAIQKISKTWYLRKCRKSNCTGKE